MSISINEAIAARRTFAIISHPDAGKTTLTEKLLLYSGMVRTAGMVRGRKGSKATSSDWMAMEQERGISITTSAMQFKYKSAIINLLDTPGHQDFSEDTYRTLTATDSAVMVIDAAKGVEAQTRKLFAVCRMRNIPILTFINKMDLPTRELFDLIDEVEKVLGIKAAPLNWPVGTGRDFKGVLDLRSRKITLFSRAIEGGEKRAAAEEISLEDLKSSGRVPEDVFQKLQEELELLEGAGTVFDESEFLAGQVSPVFFGSALTNFGVEPFFDRFVELAPAPRAVAAQTKSGEKINVDPSRPDFSGFIFKLQANMNPKHRDSVAFMRVCSGKFERDMQLKHHRSGKEIRVSRSYGMVGQERTTVDIAYPGDIVGVINPGFFSIGDTLSACENVSEQAEFDFVGMPLFAPEAMAQIRPKDVMRRKAFEKGLQQLCAEGAVQMLRPFDRPEGAPFVAAVGRLQFDVLQFRLQSEYGVETILEPLPFKESAWLIGDVRSVKKALNSALALDRDGQVVVLFASTWERNYLLERNPEHGLREYSK